MANLQPFHATILTFGDRRIQIDVWLPEDTPEEAIDRIIARRLGLRARRLKRKAKRNRQTGRLSST